MSHSNNKIVLLTLGEELLLGLTPNSHLTFIGDQLRKHGVTLHSNLTISDEAEDIKTEFESLWANADIVITSGGLGPTVDDRTKEIIAQSIGEELVFDPSIQTAIEERFKKLGLHMTENNRKQAFRPECAEVLENPNGTAPGLWIEKDGKILIMLPGPPRELIPLFKNEVIPRLARLGKVEAAENYFQIRTIGVGESSLETKLQPIVEKYTDLTVAYCAHQGHVDVRLSFTNHEERDDDILKLAAECKTMLGSDFMCFGHDSLAEVVSKILRTKKTTLALAESCTGGLIANAITDISGASEFFRGGIACYQDDVKIDMLNVPVSMIQQHTAVSQEVAIAMAAGASEKFEAEYTLSTTGYAGPNGGDDNNPVGTVFVGLHSSTGIWCQKLQLRGTREEIKRRAMTVSLDWLRRTLIERPEKNQNHNELQKESDKILRSLS